MQEFKFPGLSAQLKGDAAKKQSKAAYEVVEEKKKAAKKQERIEDANFLQSSQVLKALKEAAKLLKQGGRGPSLTVTNPNFSDPIDLKLTWDVKRREDSHPLLGSDDYHGTVYSWNEANCRLVKDEEGKIEGLEFNIPLQESNHPLFECFFESSLHLDDIVTAVDRAVTHPLRLDEEHGDGSLPLGHARIENERRIGISFS
jgi:hypothetical protein